MDVCSKSCAVVGFVCLLPVAACLDLYPISRSVYLKHAEIEITAWKHHFHLKMFYQVRAENISSD